MCSLEEELITRFQNTPISHSPWDGVKIKVHVHNYTIWGISCDYFQLFNMSSFEKEAITRFQDHNRFPSPWGEVRSKIAHAWLGTGVLGTR